MIEIIIDFFLTIAGGIISLLMSMFNSWIDIDLYSLSKTIPPLTTFYRIFQGIGIGLVICIAVCQLIKFFVSPLTKTTERPVVVLVRAFIAVAFIYYGNYILNYFFDITQTLYKSFISVSIYEPGSNFGDVLMNNFSSWYSSSGYEWIAEVTGLSAAIVLILSICLVIQTIKAMLEILERFLLLCLLIFSSPLPFAAFASESTMPVFKKWIQMFFSQCLLLILSAWGLILFLSCMFDHTIDGGLDVMARAFYAFALVRLIKRLDTYMRQIGLNPGMIGGMGILESIALSAGSLKRLFGNSGGKGAKESGGKPLGNSIMGNMISHSPIAAVYNGFKGGKAYKEAGESATRGFFAGVVSGGGKRPVGPGTTKGETAAAIFHKNSGQPPLTGESVKTRKDLEQGLRSGADTFRQNQERFRETSKALSDAQATKDPSKITTAANAQQKAAEAYAESISQQQQRITQAESAGFTEKALQGYRDQVSGMFDGMSDHEKAKVAFETIDYGADHGGVTFKGADAITMAQAAMGSNSNGNSNFTSATGFDGTNGRIDNAELHAFRDPAQGKDGTAGPAVFNFSGTYVDSGGVSSNVVVSNKYGHAAVMPEHQEHVTKDIQRHGGSLSDMHWFSKQNTSEADLKAARQEPKAYTPKKKK